MKKWAGRIAFWAGLAGLVIALGFMLWSVWSAWPLFRDGDRRSPAGRPLYGQTGAGAQQAGAQQAGAQQAGAQQAVPLRARASAPRVLDRGDCRAMEEFLRLQGHKVRVFCGTREDVPRGVKVTMQVQWASGAMVTWPEVFGPIDNSRTLAGDWPEQEFYDGNPAPRR